MSKCCNKCGTSLTLHENFQPHRLKKCDYICNECHKMVKRNSHVKRTFGIDSDQYDKMRDEHDGACKICGTETSGHTSGQFVLDHDHDTGKIRGWLCNKCNSALGFFNDDIKLVKAAYEYLKSHQS